MKALALTGLVLLGITMTSQPVRAADTRMFVRHEVNDYATWRKGFDAFRPQGKKMGAATAAVYQSLDNPNDVTVTHDFKTMGLAERHKSHSNCNQVVGEDLQECQQPLMFADTHLTAGRGDHDGIRL